MKTIKRHFNIFLFSVFALVFMLGVTSNAQEAAGLNEEEKSLVAISSYTAQGDLDGLETALKEGLDAGLTINEIKEALVQLYAYCGFPRSLNGITTFMNVLDERQENGIQDEEGEEIILNNETEDKYQQGLEVLRELIGMDLGRPTQGYGAFAPRIDVFLKEHLFADIFASDVLTYHQRELVTIAALASMQGTESQLRAHIGMGMNVGVTQNQLGDLFDVIENSVGEEEAANGRNIIQNMPGGRNN